MTASSSAIYGGRVLLDGATVAQVLAWAKHCIWNECTVGDSEEGARIEVTTRSGQYARLQGDLELGIVTRLYQAQRWIEDRLGVELDGLESPPALLRYRAGDGFRLHRDSSGDHAVSTWVRDRCVTAVIVLSTFQDYGGGELEIASEHGLETVRVMPGWLVAFHSDAIHGVRRVVSGERYSLVTWFRGPRRCGHREPIAGSESHA